MTNHAGAAVILYRCNKQLQQAKLERCRTICEYSIAEMLTYFILLYINKGNHDCYYNKLIEILATLTRNVALE